MAKITNEEIQSLRGSFIEAAEINLAGRDHALSVMKGVANVCVAVVETARDNMTSLELQAILTKGLQFGQLLIGALDEGTKTDTPERTYYQNEVLPVITDIIQFNAHQAALRRAALKPANDEVA
jgi:hypothetical protein